MQYFVTCFMFLFCFNIFLHCYNIVLQAKMLCYNNLHYNVTMIMRQIHTLSKFIPMSVFDVLSMLRILYTLLVCYNNFLYIFDVYIDYIISTLHIPFSSL